MKSPSNNRIIVLLIALGLSLLAGCQHFNVTQITYDLLRADDCRRNKLEDFCGRTYAREYHEYMRIRRDFMREELSQKKPLRPNELTLHKVLNSR